MSDCRCWDIALIRLPPSTTAKNATISTDITLTPTKAPVSRAARESPRRGRLLPIRIDAEPVTPAEDGHDDLRMVRVPLDLPAQILHVGVDAALVPLELVAADAVDEFCPR